MRQRITFIHEPEDAVDPKSIKITSVSFTAPGLKAVREDRVTLGFNELPPEIRYVLEQAHELHVRYVTPMAYDMMSPFASRLSPGLHVYFTPQRNSKIKTDLLCPLMHKVFGLKDKLRCETPDKSFTSLPSQRFQHSTAYEYFQPLDQLLPYALVDYLTSRCPQSDSACINRTRSLQDATSIDIDFDTVSHALTVSAVWKSQKWDFSILKQDGKGRVEVGILSNEVPTEKEEQSLAGFLTVVGEDTKPSPTLFSFPARHHPHTASFSTKFLEPTGLHPNLQLKISHSKPPPEHEICSLHAYLTFPRLIFADKYQLSDPLFMASKNLSAVRYMSSPVDLEAPEYTMSLWGSSLLLELAPPEPSQQPWFAEIPLHLRYLPPSDSGYQQAAIPWPVLFWACTAEEGSKFTINPFDRVNLGYDGLFGPRTMFHHLTPKLDSRHSNASHFHNVINVPVLKQGYTQWVELGTAGVILLGFGWVMWRLYIVWKTEGYGNHSSAKRKKTQ